MSKTVSWMAGIGLMFGASLTGQTGCKPDDGVCLPSVKSQCVSDCSQRCGDVGECIFGCEIGQFTSVDQCTFDCNGLGEPCLQSCLVTVDCINLGCNVVTDKLNISRGAIVYNRSTKVWQQTIVVTNSGCTDLTGLAYFVDSLSSGWGLTNGDGTTTGGLVYKKLGSLQSQSVTTITLLFSRTGATVFDYTPRVVSGLY